MKVVISTYTFLPDIGGVATDVYFQARGFAGRGHEVTVVTETPGPDADYGFTVVRKPSAQALIAIYRDADLLILSNLSLKLGWPLLFMGRPFALRHHSESAFALKRTRPADFVKSLLYRRVTVHLMTSRFIGHKSGIRQFVVTPPVANPENITASVIRPPSERHGAIFVGRMVEEKGVNYLLERWPKAKAALDIDSLRLIGGGPLASEISAKAGTGDLADVTFVGSLSLKETAVEMGRARYCFVPSLWEEPFGAVALEALAAGAIVVVADRGGLSEAVGPYGLLYDPFDEASLDRALRDARQKADLIRESDEEAEKYRQDVSAWVDQFTPAEVTGKIISALAPTLH